MMYSLRAFAAIIGAVIVVVHARTPCSAVQPPATPTATCGLRGTLNDDAGNWAVAFPAVVSSLEECARLCEDRRINPKHDQILYNYWCRSFYYDSANSLCGLGTNDVAHEVHANESSPQVFYSYRCFSCGPFCDQPYGQQLLGNGDFEKHPFGPWTNENVGDTGGPGPGFNSATSWQAKPKSDIGLEQKWNQCGGYFYKFSFDYKVTPSGPEPPKFTASSGTFRYQNRVSTGTSGQWRSITGFLQGGGEIGFYMGNFHAENGANTYNIDNVVVSRFPAVPKTKPLAQPAFQNGGFESGGLAPWTFDNGPKYIKSPGISGSDYASFVDIPEKEGREFFLSQSMQTQRNTNYLFSFDYNILGERYHGTDSPVSVRFDYGSGSDVTDVPYFVGLHWGKGTFRFPIGVQTAESVFSMNFVTSVYWKGGNATFDNFQLEEIIE